MVLLVPALMLLVLLVVQGALYFHAANVATAAAEPRSRPVDERLWWSEGAHRPEMCARGRPKRQDRHELIARPPG